MRTNILRKSTYGNVNLLRQHLVTLLLHLWRANPTVGWLRIKENYLKDVDDVIKILHKVKDRLDLHECFAHDLGGSRFANEEERCKIQEANYPNLKLRVHVAPSVVLRSERK